MGKWRCQHTKKYPHAYHGWLQNPSFEDAFPMEHFWIFRPVMLVFGGQILSSGNNHQPLAAELSRSFWMCLVATGWCTKICKFDWVMWYVWPVKETLGPWATWNKQPTTEGMCDHIILSWFCHFAVQNPKLTSRFCCVFQRVNSCTPPWKLTFPSKTENWWLENEMFF